MKAIFWAKMKLAAVAVTAAALLGAATPLALHAVSGEPAAEEPKPEAEAKAKDDGNQPVPVKGLKMTLSAGPNELVCGDLCQNLLLPTKELNKCADCGRQYRSSCKTCWDCAFQKGTCEACGKELPAEKLLVGKVKAGDTVRLAVTFENVSEKNFRVCNYMLGAWLLKWEATGPKDNSIQKAMTGVAYMLAPITLENYPELAPGGKLTWSVTIAGNPPTLNQGTHLTRLLHPGKYQLTAAYTGKRDTYYDPDKGFNTPVPGTVWKGTVESQVLELEFEGDFEPAPPPRRGGIRPMAM